MRFSSRSGFADWAGREGAVAMRRVTAGRVAESLSMTQLWTHTLEDAFRFGWRVVETGTGGNRDSLN